MSGGAPKSARVGHSTIPLWKPKAGGDQETSNTSAMAPKGLNHEPGTLSRQTYPEPVTLLTRPKPDHEPVSLSRFLEVWDGVEPVPTEQWVQSANLSPY